MAGVKPRWMQVHLSVRHGVVSDVTKGGIYGCMLTTACLAAAVACAQEEARSTLEIGDTAWLLATAALILLAMRSVWVERFVSAWQRC